MRKRFLSITGALVLLSLLAGAFKAPGLLVNIGKNLGRKAPKSAPLVGDVAVKADLFYRNDQYENTISPRLFVIPLDSKPYLTRPETLSLVQLEPSDPIPDLSIPESCEVSTNVAYEFKLFELINEERVKRNLEPLTWNGDLADAARKHSINMACNDFFSHVNPERVSFDERITAEGYDYFAVGENIYAGDEVFNSPYRAFRAWFYSTDHFVVMTHTALTEVGIGYVYCNGSRYGGYFTADFASPE
jgi:uncharacterized protein YkwD